MLVSLPYRYIAARSGAFRQAVTRLSSEQWSLIGFSILILSAIAGALGYPSVYILCLLGHDVCDLNDGYVYRQKERGAANGYGLYLDHILDSIGASLATYGGYCLVGEPLACTIGLVMFYLIAIHSWLFKVTRLARGQADGLYFGVTLSEEKIIWLNVDDLTLVMALIVLTHWMPLLYIMDAGLLCILVVKVVRACLELRKTQWRP